MQQFVRWHLDGWQISWPPLNDLLLAFWLFFSSIQTTHSSFLFVTKQIHRFPFVFIAEGICYILLALLVGYRWAIPGIIVCSAVCVVLFSCSFSLRKSSKFFHVSYSTLLLSWLRPAINLGALLIPLAVVLWLATNGLPAIWRLVIHGFGSGLCGGLLFLRFCVPRQDLKDTMAHIPMFPFKTRIKQYLDNVSRTP